jgi:protein involved in polysaccharide export with SLBB domain
MRVTPSLGRIVAWLPRIDSVPILCFPFPLLVFLAGCLPHRHLDQALLADRGAAVRNQGVAECYTLGCPDVVEVRAAGRPDVKGPRTIGPDGRISLDKASPLRIEGQTPGEATLSIAKHLGVPPGSVHLQVVKFQSRFVYLSGEGTGVPRAVPYQGQETVLDLLQRVGGITPGAALGEVYVVRSHVADGDRPEVFHVDLQGIILKKDQHTNLRLEPFDQVYVGESRQGKLDKCLPPCLRPFYQAVHGIGPVKHGNPPGFIPPGAVDH